MDYSQFIGGTNEGSNCILTNWDTMKYGLCLGIASKSKRGGNKFLDDIPTMTFLTDSIFLYARIDLNVGVSGKPEYVNVTKGMCDIWKVSVEEMFDFAIQNAPTKEKPVFYDKHLREFGITTSSEICGAAVMCYPDVLSKISMKFKSGFFIIPISTDGIYVVADKKMMGKDIMEAMKNFNGWQNSLESINAESSNLLPSNIDIALSDTIFHFNYETQSIERGDEFLNQIYEKHINEPYELEQEVI